MTECRKPPLLSTWVFEAEGDEWEIDAASKEKAWAAIRGEIPDSEICFMGARPRANPAASSERSAETNFRMWHRKDPRRRITVKNAIDPKKHAEMASIGRALDIVYSSDKWEKDGTFYPYEHDFTSKPKVWVPVSTVPSSDEIVGRHRKTAGFLGERNLTGAKAVAQLAFVEELLYLDADGDETRLIVGKKAIMACSPDRKTVLILASFGPVLISGGKMIVTSRGIVH